MKTIVLMDFPLEKGTDGMIIPLSGEAEEMLREKKISYTEPGKYKSGIGIDRKFVDDIRKFWDSDCVKGLFYEKNYGFSLSWIVEDWLLGTTPYCESIINILDFIAFLGEVIRKESPDKIVLVSRNAEKISVCRQIKNCEFLDVGRDKNRMRLKSTRHRLFVYRSVLRRIKRRKGEKEGIKILSFAAKRLRVLCGEPRNVMDAVFDYFPEKEKYRLVIADFSARRYEKGSVSCVPVEDYLKISDIRFAKKSSREIRKRWEFLKTTVRDEFMFRGFDLYEVIAPKLDFFFSNFLERVFIEMRMFENAILQENPVLIINDDAPNIRGIEIAAVARTHGTKNLALQHGGMIGNWITNMLTEGEADQKSAYSFPLPDFMTSHGMNDKKFMNRTTKIKGAAIFNVGDPQYDFLFGAELNSKDIRSKFKIPERKTILFAPSTDNPSSEKARIAGIVSSAVRRLGAQVIVKLHPREKEGNIYSNVMKGLPNIIFIDQKIRETHKLIAVSDVVISDYSSVGLEAVLLKKPSIMVDPFGKYKNINYYGAILNVSSGRELENALRRILDVRLKMPRKKFIENFYFRDDGMACKRIADVIYRLVRK